MSLKAIYQSESEIPEGAKPFYKKNADDSFSIDLDGGVKTQADIERVQTALEKERDITEALKKDIAKFPKDFDVEKWEKVKNIDPNKKPSTGDKTEDEIRKELTEEFRTKEQELEEKFKKKEQEYEVRVNQANDSAKNYVTDSWKRKVLAEKFGFTDPRRLNALILEIKHGNDPEFSEIRRLFKSIEATEENGSYSVVGGSLKDAKGAYDALESISQLEITKYYKPAKDNSGGGAGGGGGEGVTKDNPFAKENHSVTKQSYLIKNEPDKARKLAKEAGWSDEDISKIK